MTLDVNVATPGPQLRCWKDYLAAVRMRKHLGEADTRLLEILACTFDKGMIHTITFIFCGLHQERYFIFQSIGQNILIAKFFQKHFEPFQNNFASF